MADMVARLDKVLDERERHCADQRRWLAAHPDYHRRYRDANKEHIQARQAAYRARTREHAKLVAKEWRAKHREQLRQQRRAYYAAHKGTSITVAHEWALAHPERVKASQERTRLRQWAKNHPEEVLARAREIVGAPPPNIDLFPDPLRDDLIQEAVMAMLEGRDPKMAVRVYRTREVSWGIKTRGMDFEPPAA